MKKIRGRVGTVDVLFFAGAALVSVGVGLLALPAGLIAAGCFALAASVLADRGGGGGEGGDKPA